MWVGRTGHGEDAVSTQEERQLSMSVRRERIRHNFISLPSNGRLPAVAAFHRAEKVRKSEGRVRYRISFSDG